MRAVSILRRWLSPTLNFVHSARLVSLWTAVAGLVESRKASITVYEAQHAAIGRRFAIKFLHSLLASNSESVARFQREAQAAGGLENENIAAVVDIGTADDGAPFLVMEYLEGEDLAKLLVRDGPLSVPRAAYIIIQACRGLAAAHSRGIVHRDLKPEGTSYVSHSGQEHGGGRVFECHCEVLRDDLFVVELISDVKRRKVGHDHSLSLLGNRSQPKWIRISEMPSPTARQSPKFPATKPSS